MKLSASYLPQWAWLALTILYGLAIIVSVIGFVSFLTARR